MNDLELIALIKELSALSIAALQVFRDNTEDIKTRKIASDLLRSRKLEATSQRMLQSIKQQSVGENSFQKGIEQADKHIKF